MEKKEVGKKKSVKAGLGTFLSVSIETILPADKKLGCIKEKCNLTISNVTVSSFCSGAFMRFHFLKTEYTGSQYLLLAHYKCCLRISSA